MLFGKTLSETVTALKGPIAGSEQQPADDKFVTRTQAIARIVITLLLLLFAFYCYDKAGSSDKEREIAATIIGAILGYWLR